MSHEQEPFDPESIPFIDNPEDRCPVVLLLDTSYSMSGERIAALNEGLLTFEREIKGDELAAKRVDISLVTFGPVNLEKGFTNAKDFEPGSLEPNGNTPMGEAIEFGINLLSEQKSIYLKNGISYYRPWVMLITDGAPTDNIDNAKRLVWDGEKNKEFMFFAIGVQDADMTRLNDISLREAMKLDGLNFNELFSWLSSSLSGVSQSTMGTEVPLAPVGWGSTDYDTA